MVGRGTFNGDKDAILSKVTEAELAAMYIPELKEIPSVIKSPLRKDEHPSFRVYSPDGTKVRFYDYATGDSGGIVDFIMRVFNCKFDEALSHIEEDLTQFRKGIKVSKSTFSGKIQVRADSPDFQIRSQKRDWEDYDFEYWESYGVPKNWLLNADIYPIQYIFIISETGYIKTIKADKYAYTFIERKDGRITEKVYQPFNKDGMKWRSGHDSSVWDLWTKLPKRGNIVIITSSRKDALCLWANTGIPSVSLQSETANVKPQVMEELKSRFKRVLILYDNDFGKDVNHGRIDGIKLAGLFKIEQIEIPTSYQAKDISDLFHKYGKQTVQKVIKYLIHDETTDYNL